MPQNNKSDYEKHLKMIKERMNNSECRTGIIILKRVVGFALILLCFIVGCLGLISFRRHRFLLLFISRRLLVVFLPLQEGLKPLHLINREI